MGELMGIENIRTSRKPDTKNVFKSEEKEKAFKKRYGKKVNVSVTYDTKTDKFESMDDLSEYTVRFESDKGHHYAITEYLVNGDTDYVIFSYIVNNKNYENKFDRYVDAEITLADRISEEI